MVSIPYGNGAMGAIFSCGLLTLVLVFIGVVRTAHGTLLNYNHVNSGPVSCSYLEE